MNKVKEHFEQEAHEFDEIIIKLIPYYLQMLEALISSIPFECDQKISVIDLGCGTGTISKLIKEKYSNATITCLDIAENMLEISKTKLQKFSGIEYTIADFNKFCFGDTYDVVVSSLALHHLVTGQDKIDFYNKIYAALNPGGFFANADVILASSDSLQKNYIEKWKLFMQNNVPVEEIENKWIPKYKAEDRPAKLIDQLDWLKDVGFINIDIIWKYYNFAVYCGMRKKGNINEYYEI